MACDRPCKGDALVTKHRAFEQTCRNCRAIHLDERAIGSVAALVYGFRNQFLAGACFTVDQHRGVELVGRDPFNWPLRFNSEQPACQETAVFPGGTYRVAGILEMDLFFAFLPPPASGFHFVILGSGARASEIPF